MKISNIALFATLMLGASLPHQAVAQQVISKGSWVLENPAPGYGPIKTFPSADACVAHARILNAEVAENVAQSDKTYYALLNQETRQWNEQHLMASQAQISEEGRLMQIDNIAHELAQEMAGANCVQQ